jgi:hypothetical protein
MVVNINYCTLKALFTAEPQRALRTVILCLPLILQRHWRTGRTANIKVNLPKEQKTISIYLSEFIMQSYCPKGCRFSFSGLSAENEKKNQLCALCVSSEAGGEIMSKQL